MPLRVRIDRPVSQLVGHVGHHTLAARTISGNMIALLDVAPSRVSHIAQRRRVDGSIKFPHYARMVRPSMC